VSNTSDYDYARFFEFLHKLVSLACELAGPIST